MAPSNIVDSLYERTASFGRDLFHYIVTGTMFAVVSSVPWWSKLNECRANVIAPILEDVRVQIALLFVAVIVLFGMGHVLLAIGFCLQKWWVAAFRCSQHVARYEAARQRVRGATGRKSGFRHLAVKSDSDVHMGLEMSVLRAQPKLHAVFIERYNTLWHLRLGMAAALLSAGIVALALCGFRCDGMAAIVGLVAIALGLLLMRQHLVTKTNFLIRVVVAFRMSKQTRP